MCLLCIILPDGGQHATTTNFPRLRAVLTHLLFGEPKSEASTPGSSNTVPGDGVMEMLSPAMQYPTLPVSDKIATLSFFCDLAITSKPIHSFMDSCEVSLTDLRKEKIEVNRLRKQWYGIAHI